MALLAWADFTCPHTYAQPGTMQVVTREAGVIAILRSEGDQQVIVRIRAELDASEFTIVEIQPEPGASVPTLAELAATHSADAALRVRTAPNRVELWTSSSSEQTQGTLDTITVRGAEAQLDEVLALRVVETLRARGLGLRHTSQPPPPIAKPEEEIAKLDEELDKELDEERSANDERDSTEATAASSSSELPAREPSRARAPQLWIELAPAVSLSPGRLGPQIEAWLSARLQLERFASITAFASVPLWREEIDEAEGTAHVATWLVGGAGDVHVRISPFDLSAGAGIAAVIAQMTGSAAAPLEGTDATVLAAAPLVRAAMQLELSAGLRLFARGQLGVSIPAISVRFTEASSFAEREVASWGRPFAMLGVGVEIGLVERTFSD